jgi:hypothetical protein
MCGACFMMKIEKGMSDTDLIDPFACPMCKKTGYFAGPVSVVDEDVTGKCADVVGTHKMRQELWEACVRDIEDGGAALPALQNGYIPTILYAAYIANKTVITNALPIKDPEQKAQFLHDNLHGIGDQPSDRNRRSGVLATIARVEGGLRKRRRCSVDILNEVRDLAAMLEDDNEEPELDPPGALYLVAVFGDATLMWIHADLGTAVARMMRVSASSDDSRVATSLVKCETCHTSPATSSIIAVVAGKADPGVAAAAVMRQLRAGHCDAMVDDALASSMIACVHNGDTPPT